MGNDNNSTMAETSNSVTWVQYNQLKNVAGSPILLISTLNPYLHAQKYYIFSDSSHLHSDVKMYQNRRRVHKNIVEIYDFSWDSVSLSNEKNAKICVVSERIPFRLGDFKEYKMFSFQQILYILRQVLTGYQVLYSHKLAFTPTSKMIGINNQAEVKVWIHQSWVVNDFVQLRPTAQVESELVVQIIQAVFECVAASPMKFGFLDKVKETIYQRKGFLGILDLIGNYHLDQQVLKKGIVSKLTQKIEEGFKWKDFTKKRASSQGQTKNSKKSLTNSEQSRGKIHNKSVIEDMVRPNSRRAHSDFNYLIQTSRNQPPNSHSTNNHIQETKVSGHLQQSKNGSNLDHTKQKNDQQYSSLNLSSHLNAKLVGDSENVKNSKYYLQNQNMSNANIATKIIWEMRKKREANSQFVAKSPDRQPNKEKSHSPYHSFTHTFHNESNLDQKPLAFQAQPKFNAVSAINFHNHTSNLHYRVNRQKNAKNLSIQTAFANAKCNLNNSVGNYSTKAGTPANYKPVVNAQSVRTTKTPKNESSEQKSVSPSFWKKKSSKNSLSPTHANKQEYRKKDHPLSIISQQGVAFSFMHKKAEKVDQTLQTQPIQALQKRRKIKVRRDEGVDNRFLRQSLAYLSQLQNENKLKKQVKEEILQIIGATKKKQKCFLTEQDEQLEESSETMGQQVGPVDQGKMYLNIFKYYLGACEEGQSDNGNPVVCHPEQDTIRVIEWEDDTVKEDSNSLFDQLMLDTIEEASENEQTLTNYQPLSHASEIE